mgnify:FL=1
MGIFDFVNDILYKKSGKLLEKKELESELQPYMLQRWISMHSNTNARILAATLNKMYKSIDDKDQWYKLFLTTVPRSTFKRFKYIKKVSKGSGKKKTDMEEAIELVAKAKQVSKREVREYVEEYGLDLSDIKQRLKESKD